MRILYTVLLYLATPLLLLRLWWKGRSLPGYRSRIGERFGFVPPPPEGAALWVHAVSVGETLAALPLIQHFIEAHGEGRVWVTTTTPTGSDRVLQALGGRVRHSFMPYDLPGAQARFLARVRPARLVIIETEIWPNLFRACHQRGVPIVLANARLSRRSFRGYTRVSKAIGGTLSQCSAIAAQTKADAWRFRRLGAPAAIVSIMGNLKYDVPVPEDRVSQGRELRALLGRTRPIWTAASTHEGEDADVLAAHRAVVDVLPDAALILVPRHPERFDAVWKLVRDSGMSAERRSRQQALIRGGHPPDLSATQVFLGDSMGEMFMYLAAADAAFVGGSLAAIGGHNVLEPAALGLPVLFGPHMSNFAAARALLLRADAAEEIGSAASLAGAVASLLGGSERRAAMGRAGAQAVAGNRGALKRILAIIEATPMRSEKRA